MRRFRFQAGIAAYLRVTDLTNPGVDGPREIPVIYMSPGVVVVGIRDTPLADYGWPLQVQEEIHKHFATVFRLDHEKWTSSYGAPSPRSLYLEDLEPWEIEVPDSPP